MAQEAAPSSRSASEPDPTLLAEAAKQARESASAALGQASVHEEDWTIDKAGGDPQVFFHSLFTRWIVSALRALRPGFQYTPTFSPEEFDMSLPELEDASQFEGLDSEDVARRIEEAVLKGKINIKIRAKSKNVVVFPLLRYDVPTDAMRDFPDYVCGRILLQRCGELSAFLNTPLRDARYWILAGPWHLENLDQEAKKRQSEEMAKKLQEQTAPAPGPARPRPPVPPSRQGAGPKKPVTLVQTLTIWFDATELRAMEVAQKTPLTTALTKD